MKIIFTVLLTSFLTFSSLADTKESNAKATVVNETVDNKAEAKRLTARLHDIRDLVKGKNLSEDEKLQLRNEVLDIRDRLESLSGVSIYLSLTAILIILLLIILI